MRRQERKPYVSEFLHGKRRPPPTPSSHLHLAPLPADAPKVIATTASVNSSLVREDRRAKDRRGAEAAPRVSASQPDEHRQSSARLHEQSKSNEKEQAL